MGRRPPPPTIQQTAWRLTLVLLLGASAACPAARPADEVWLDQAPHLLDLEWRLPGPGERGVVATVPRSVLEFFTPTEDAVRVRLHGWSLRPEPVTVQVTLNGGCEVGSWILTANGSDGAFQASSPCMRAGINRLELETHRADMGGFALESLSIEAVTPAAAGKGSSDDPPRREPARIGLQVRTALISPYASFDIPLRVEEPSILETAVGLPGSGWRRSTVPVAVRLRVRGAGGNERVVAEQQLGAGGEGGAWIPVRADLSDYAGQDVVLRVERKSVRGTQATNPAFPSFADPARFVTIESPRLLPLRAKPDAPPPVVMVVFDTLRADHLPMYGYRRETSPNLAALARDGVTFETCLAPSPWTLPSVASILTGLYPWQHQAGLRRPLKGALSPEEEADILAPFRTFRMLSRMTPHARTLAERMSEAGYLSAGFVENSYLSDRSGLARGFTRYLWDNDLRKDVEDPLRRRRFFTSDLRAREWIEGHESSRLFIFRHYIAPHLPYMAIPGEERFVRPQDAPELGHYFEDEEGAVHGQYGPAARRRIVDLYDESIFLADRRFGDLVAALRSAGLYERALIIVTSDHGEEFWDDGGYGHGHSLYGEVLRVPLIVKTPGGRFAGSRVSSPVRLIDLAPTILETARISAEGLPGASLPFERDRRDPIEAFAGAVLYGPPRRMAMRENLALIVTEMRPESLIFANRPSPPVRPVELYDWEADPREERDLSRSRPDLVETMKRTLETGWRSTTLDQPAAGGLELSQEEIEQLESLGYAAHPRGGSPKSGEAPRDGAVDGKKVGSAGEGGGS